MSVKSDDKKYIADTYARFDINIVSGKGSIFYDENGKEYIDMGTGIAVNTFGFCDESWKDAVIKQLDAFQHTSNLYYAEPCVTLAKMLCEKTGAKKVFFGNSGAEANECAIKAARKYAENKGIKDGVILTLENSFHGRTITTLAATGQDVFHNDFLPLTGGFVHAKANDCADLERAVKENNVIAIMFETVQGEGGVLPLNQEFVDKINEIAEKNDILMIVDEVQTGNGRTGKLYGYMNYGVRPDIVSTAKGLAGGLPIGATMLFDKCKDVFTPGSHGSTFGGNPICCAAAVNVLSRIDDKLLGEVKEKSDYIFNELNGANGIKSVSGMGLMIGIETEKDAGDILKICLENGVSVLKAKTKIRLLPALNIPFETLKKAVEVIKKACE
ncbi:MAG: acetylornithine/succinylornithine family transaminase [Acutalibacteraceae bacterium]|nr:acetylornithine/succinylornithine family transaminase [Acutalibacteraceae bacterium]